MYEEATIITTMCQYRFETIDFQTCSMISSGFCQSLIKRKDEVKACGQHNFQRNNEKMFCACQRRTREK